MMCILHECVGAPQTLGRSHSGEDIPMAAYGRSSPVATDTGKCWSGAVLLVVVLELLWVLSLWDCRLLLWQVLALFQGQ